MDRLFAAFETEGNRYGLKINRIKCELVALRTTRKLVFRDGTKVHRKDVVKHLGCLLNSRGDPGKEVVKRISECMTTPKRMHLFWRHGDLSIKPKTNGVQRGYDV